MQQPLEQQALEVRIHGEDSPLLTLQLSQLPPGASLLDVCCASSSAPLPEQQAWFEDEHGMPLPADVKSDAMSVLRALPCFPARLVFGRQDGGGATTATTSTDTPQPTAQPAIASSSNQHVDQAQQVPKGSRSKGRKWLRQLRRLALTAIQVIVVVEGTKSVMEHARLLRYMGRHERWGPSSSEASAGSDVGTSSEAADLLLDYMQDEVGLEALQGFNTQQLERAMSKITTEDLEEMGVPDAHAQLASVRSTIAEANAAEDKR